MLVTLEEAKEYLKVEYEEEDSLVLTFLTTAEGLVEDILRTSPQTEDAVARTAILYAVGVLFENRGTPETADLVPVLKSLLSGRREAVF